MSADRLLQVDDLQVNAEKTKLVRGISFELGAGEALGLVGESGCGKSLVALSIMQLLAQPPMRIVSGKIRFNNTELTDQSERAMERIRGRAISMIFQEPMTSLNPVYTVGDQVAEVLLLHKQITRAHARQRTTELLDTVGLSASRLSKCFPHQLSGGQRQRVMIAMALACTPKLLIADEPTTALDVTVQAQILELIDQLRREYGMAILLIAHDLGVVRHYCERVAVMYAGQIVECGPTEQVFMSPSHPYTKALIETIPALNPPGNRLPSIEGLVPRPDEITEGCAFAPRCRFSQPQCDTQLPLLEDVSASAHQVRCWFPQSIQAPV
jgi:oligopeptide/dipeptide ABC transporter ATP-binding protein